MEPNELPLVLLPLELPPDSAAILIEFLHDLADAVERHYADQLMRRQESRLPSSPPSLPADAPLETDPPF